MADPPHALGPTRAKSQNAGFTLLEISIVLVILGLIVGGILVGRDLIAAAQLRAQLTQIERYNTAVNTFMVKYNALPGDMGPTQATQYGFLTFFGYIMNRTGGDGMGDNNGVIEGVNCNGVYQTWYAHDGGVSFGGGETLFFWVDLATAGFVPGVFAGYSCGSTAINQYLPPAAIGGGNYVYAYSLYGSTNYFGVSAVSNVGNAGWNLLSRPGFTVQQAYQIDTKVDDGMPVTGRVLAIYVGSTPTWSYTGAAYLGGQPNSDGTFGEENNGNYSLQGSSSTCYDNAAVANAPFSYSIGQNGGGGMNCGLSFQMQAGY